MSHYITYTPTHEPTWSNHHPVPETGSLLPDAHAGPAEGHFWWLVDRSPLPVWYSPQGYCPKRECLGKWNLSIFNSLVTFGLYLREFHLRWGACRGASSHWNLKHGADEDKMTGEKMQFSSCLQDVPTMPFRRYQTYLSLREHHQLSESRVGVKV